MKEINKTAEYLIIPEDTVLGLPGYKLNLDVPAHILFLFKMLGYYPTN